MFNGLNNNNYFPAMGHNNKNRNTKSTNHSDTIHVSSKNGNSGSNIGNNRRYRKFVTEASLNTSINGNDIQIGVENMILPNLKMQSITNNTPQNANRSKFSEDQSKSINFVKNSIRTSFDEHSSRNNKEIKNQLIINKFEFIKF